jgi:recombination DNA repair RAD52 pathway protein
MEIKKQLDSNIPQEEITTREAWSGGPKLSYLTGAYVINRMNEVLGQGNWGYQIKNLTKVFEGEIAQANGKAFTTSYIAVVEMWAKIDGNITNFQEVGYGDGTDKKSAGKAHELATKESVTDGFKRAAKNLGISMGLGLYFKSQEYIDETTSEKPKKLEPSKSQDAEPQQPPMAASGNKAVKSTASATTLHKQIKGVFSVLQAQKKVTKDDFVSSFLGGKKTDDLTVEEANATLGVIRAKFPEMGV